jgi:hypothetical protein
MQRKLLEDRINTWAQIAGIAIAAVWTAYTFVYKEIWAPQATPVNTSLSLEIRAPDSKSAARRDGMIALSIVVSATNPSSRPIQFFHSIYMVYGYRTKKKDSFDTERAKAAINSDDLVMESRFSEKEDISLVAAGRLFEDDGLKPNEKITRTELLFLPIDAFDALELAVYVPSATSIDGLEQQWELNGLGVKSTILVTSTKKVADAATLMSHEYAESEARSKIAL